MGINLCEATAILSLKRSGAVGRDIVCVGRAERFVCRHQTAALADAFNVRWPATTLNAIAADRHAEPLLEAIGFSEIRSLDASGYEGATLVHDLNQPLPAALGGTTSFVYDGGIFPACCCPA